MGSLIFLVLAAGVLPLQGAILFDECDNVREAASFWYHEADRSDTQLLAFNENQDLPIDSVSVQTVNRWDDVDHLKEIRLDNGRVDSHMLYFLKAESKERLTLVAEVEFDAPILGFVADGFLFARTNPLFAPEPTHRQTPDGPNVWSLEEAQSWTALDRVTQLSPTRIRIEFTNHSKIDPLRVFTLRSGTVLPELCGAEREGKLPVIDMNEVEPRHLPGHDTVVGINSWWGATGGFSSHVAFYYSKEYVITGVHEDQEMFYILEGTGWARLGDEEIRLKPGICFLVKPGQVHGIKADADCPGVKAFFVHGAVE